MKSVKKDMISSLPDDLLLKILSSSLSINAVVATSVLSKRWRSLWKHVTILNYDDNYDRHLRDFVYKSLPFCNYGVLRSFHLKLNPNGTPDRYFNLLARLSIREVRIETLYASLTLPRSLYSTFWPLETLILQRLSLVDVPSTQLRLQLRFLKTLHLLSVKFSDDESVQRLLSSCPVLEDLVARRTTYVNVTMFTINVPTLRSLSINYANVVFLPVVDHGFVINAPSLRYLDIRDNFSNVLRFGDMPELVKASVEITCDQPGKFLGSSLTSIRYLSLCSPVWWNLLNSVLEDAPRLQVLKLEQSHCVGHSTDFIDCWNQPFSVPQCLLSHLEIFEWRHYEGTKEEKKVAKYILANASCLKMATFSSVFAKKKLIFKKLESLPKRSEACQLVFE